MIVAIDGYSSCGKSTLAKAIAQKLGFVYVDSGAMYRAVTLYFLKHLVPLHDEKAIQNALQHISLSFQRTGSENRIFLNHEDVSEQIREMFVSDKVSEVAALKTVRVAMVQQQQKLGESTSIVMDGRDIGSVVFPHAQVKLFMTAKPEIRAQRRFDELQAKGNQEVSFEEVLENLAHRDYIDTTRTESPLTQTIDAIVLDNSHLTPKQQLEFALKHIQPFLNEFQRVKR